MKAYYLVAAVLIASTPAPAVAGPASDLVKTFYAPVGFEPDLSVRGEFTDPAKTVFEQNDKLSNNGDEIGCIDFVLAIDAQDFDEKTVKKTLKLTETVTGDSAKVIAKLSIFPGKSPDNLREIEWDLKQVGGSWKIADIASISGDWRLSKFDCSPAE